MINHCNMLLVFDVFGLVLCCVLCDQSLAFGYKEFVSAGSETKQTLTNLPKYRALASELVRIINRNQSPAVYLALDRRYKRD